MKRLIILFCVFMIYAAASAQSVVQAEYFVNDDPGFGNGTQITVNPGIDVILNFNVNTDVLENGLHTLFIRARDGNGAWSTVAHRPFLLGNFPDDPLLPLVRAEYFIDEDPGQGLGTPIPFDPNDGLTEKSFVVSLHGVEVGTRMLYIRTLDANGHWSLTHAEPFEVEIPLIIADFSANITEGSLPLSVQFTDETYISEPHTWFWDFGDGNTSTLQNPQHTYTDPGKYTVSLTATSDAGTDTETKVGYITVYPPLYTLEYFFNDDPGYGNGNPVYDYSSVLGGFDFTIPVDELENGLNILFFRAIDTLGRWSQTYSRTFIKAKLINELWPNISAAEYFFDDDPGYGSGFQLPVTPGTTGEIEVVIPLEDVAHGWHTLYFRTKDENGHWSHTISRPFLKLFIPDDPVTITHLEYFIDEDPGVGNGIPVEITPGNLVEQSFIIYPGSMPPGEYTLYVRSRDDRGGWSIVFNQAFEVEPSTGCSPPNTLTAINITTNAATLGWNPGGTEMEWEVLWGLNGFDPETEGVLIQNIFDYTYLLEGLSPATNYDFYVRAVCTDEVSDWAGPAFFTTQEEQIIELPSVQTAEVGEITKTTAQSGGNITSDGGAFVTARGVVWSASQNPTIETNEGITYDGNGNGSWVSELVELTPGTEYFVRAYATNSVGTAYGEQLSFTTLPGGSPDWEPNPYLQYNMQVIGQLEYEDGSISMNENDLVGAFVGDECRGVISPDQNFMGMLFLTVGSDLQSGETITFKAYLADEDRIVDLNESLAFENQLQIGSIPNPYIFSYGESINQGISIPAGWSGISSYILPSQPAMEDVFAPIENELIIVQTMTGMYYPGENINTIGNWVSHSAFKMKTNAACMLEILGEYETNMAVQLNAGWNLFPVVTPDGADPGDLFMPVNGFVIAKDVAGTGVFWPQYNINSIGNIVPGKAYFVLMTAPGVVDYTGMKSNGNLTGIDETLSGLGYYITPTPATHTIAILPEALKDIEVGTIIGAFEHNGNCFGATIISEHANHLTIFGDDPTTAEKDGFIEGEMIFFKTLTGFDSARAGLSGLTPTFDQNLPQSNGLFAENGLSAITGFEAAVGIGNEGIFSQLNIYPNPSDGLLNITGLGVDTEITIANAQGQIVLQGVSQSDRLTTVDLGDCKPGIYFIKIEQHEATIFRKVVLN